MRNAALGCCIGAGCPSCPPALRAAFPQHSSISPFSRRLVGQAHNVQNITRCWGQKFGVDRSVPLVTWHSEIKHVLPGGEAFLR